MKNTVKILGFVLFIIAVYVFFAEVYIPRITSSPSAALDTKSSDIIETALSQVALGEKIYKGKGSCSVCHGSDRAPQLKEIIITARERIKDKNYRGNAKNEAEYIMESLVNPSAYIVKGYGLVGSNDTVSPMPDVRKPPIGLTNEELKAIVAYLRYISK